MTRDTGPWAGPWRWPDGAALALLTTTAGCAPERVVYRRADATPRQVQSDFEDCSKWADLRARGDALDFAQREAMRGQQYGVRAAQLDAYERYFRDHQRRCMVDLGYQAQVVTDQAPMAAPATAAPAPGN